MIDWGGCLPLLSTRNGFCGAVCRSKEQPVHFVFIIYHVYWCPRQQAVAPGVLQCCSLQESRCFQPNASNHHPLPSWGFCSGQLLPGHLLGSTQTGEELQFTKEMECYWEVQLTEGRPCKAGALGLSLGLWGRSGKTSSVTMVCAQCGAWCLVGLCLLCFKAV